MTPLPRTTAARPSSSPQPLPEAHPRAYTILRTAQLCRNCSSLHETSQLMLRCELPARYGMGASVTQMKALTGDPQFNLPIETRTLETRSIPFCHTCQGWSSMTNGATCVSHLPPPPADDTRTLKPVGRYGVANTESATAGRSPGAARPKLKSADDLLAQFD